jgi:hypothetical protein
MLKEGRLKAKHWDNEVMPAIEKGILKERKDLNDGGLLVIYQQFDSIIEDTDGKFYRCTAWNPTGSESYVDIKNFKPKEG